MPVDPLHPRRLASTLLGFAIAAVALVSMAAVTAWQIGSKPAQNPAPPDPSVSLTSPVAAAGPPLPTTALSTTSAPAGSFPAGSAPTPGGPGRSAKKGVSTWDFTGVGSALRDVGAGWYYNWSAAPTAGAGTSAQFVPMIWGSGSVTATNLAKAKAAGGALLGFNEPDLSGQADLTVSAALDLWPQLQATGLRLGSPAPASGAATPGGWLDQFLAGARQRGYRVDFIALHWYGSDFSSARALAERPFGQAATGQLRGYLQAVYDRYHLPIWLTEYALIKFGPTSTYPTGDQQAAFIRSSAQMLGSLGFVERYAWFALPTSKTGDETGLYRDGSTPTMAGTAYRAVT